MNNHQIIPLSSIDHIFTGTGSYPIEFIFYYKAFIDEIALRSSLEKTLQHFPVISSRLERKSEKAYAFRISSDGLSFDVKHSDIPFEDNPRQYEYINPVDTHEGKQLAKIRLTHTPDGSVLGVGLSHAIGDGFSYFHFLSSWARIYQGKPIFPAIHDRNMLIPEYKKTGTKTDPEKVLSDTGLFMHEKRKVISKNDLRWENRIFTGRDLNKMHETVQNETDLRVSINDIVTARLAKEFLLKWRSRDNGEHCYISCPVDFRRILDDFPKNYFGNAIVLVTVKLTYARLQNISLSELSLMIRSAVKKVDINYITQSLHTITALRHEFGRKIFERMHVMHPFNGLLVTNLSRLPIHEIEFSAGPPVKYNILTQTVRGAVILPHHDGLEIRVGCPARNK